MAKNSTVDSIPKEKPTIRLDESDFPDIKNLKIDDECTFTVKAKLQHLAREEWGTDKRIWGRFTIQSVKSDDGDPGLKGFSSVKPEHVTKGK